MKYLMYLTGIAALAIVIIVAEFTGMTDKFINSFDDTDQYESQISATTTIRTVEISEKSVRIKAAQDLKADEVETEAKAAYNAYYSNAMTEIKAEVLKEMEAEFRAERTAAEKEIGTY